MNGDSDQLRATAPVSAADTALTDARAVADAGEAHRQVMARIAAACRAHGRNPDTVTLLAVSKTFDASHVLAMAATGQRAFGENYLQEAVAKQQALADQRSVPGLEWHFIGPIQSNKTRQVAEHFDWVHSVDREKIARRLSEQRPAGTAPLQICLQVNVDDESSKSGCAPDDAPALAMTLASLPAIELRGLMAIPKASDDPARQRQTFRRTRELFETCLASLQRADRGARFDTLSMGMTGDLESAIAEGATIVRVGTALFGSRTAR